MKTIVLSIAAFLLLLPSIATAKDRTFTGEIMDSQCAAVGSHAMALKKMGMGNMDPNSLEAKKACTLKSVSMGAKFVLYNALHKTIYQLDDQKKPADFAGQKVKVTGTFDKATKTIHVTSIQAAS